MPGTIVRALRDAGTRNPAVHDRRDRQDGSRLPRRPRERDARGARPRAELELPRPLPRSALRSLRRDLHRDGEPARHRPGPAPGPHGGDPARRLHDRREGPHRQALPRPPPARGERPAPVPGGAGGPSADRDHRGVHARGRRAQPRAHDRHRVPQGRARRGRGAGEEEGHRLGQAGPRAARQAPRLLRAAAAHQGPGRRDRPRLDPGRRRGPVHRGELDEGLGQAHDHGPARRRDARVRSGGALVGAGAHQRPAS